MRCSIPSPDMPPRVPLLVLYFTLILAWAVPSAAQSPIYLPQNNLIVVEAESLPLEGAWVIESTEDNYTGSGYLRWNGTNNFNTPGIGTLTLSFRIETAGDYRFKLRSSHLGAPAGDQENDCWLRVNESDWFKAIHPSTWMNDGFTFNTSLEASGGEFSSPLFTLDAGVHTLYLSGRSRNYKLDRIHIYKSTGVPDPENPTYPQSPTEGGSGGSTGTLTVVNGTGDGTYPAGTVVTIQANAAPEGQMFDRWTGATGSVANVLSASTTVTIPEASITVTATYRNEDPVVELREPDPPANPAPGILYEYYEQRWDFLGDFSALTPVTTGITDDIDLDEGGRADEYLLRFTGYLEAPADGDYTLYTASDDGSQLFIGDQMVVDNDSIQSVQERSGVIGLKAGLHAITISYFERTGDQALSASWAGPGFAKTEIPPSALFHEAVEGPALGDVSLNGTISALDASQVLTHAVGQILLEPASLAVGDVSGNGEVSAYDAALILRFVAGIITCFPAEPGCE